MRMITMQNKLIRHGRRAFIYTGLTLLGHQAALAGPTIGGPTIGGPTIAVRVGVIAAADAGLGRAVKETLLTDLAKSDRLTLLGESNVRGGTPLSAYTITGSCLFVDDNVVINLRMINAAGSTVPGAAANVEGRRGEVFQLIHSLAEQFTARITGASRAAAARVPAEAGNGVRLASLGRVSVPVVLSTELPEQRANESEQATSRIEDRSGRYTGVIVDTRGLKLERSMSPKIRRLDGSTVYDGADCTPDFAIEMGVVVYAKRMNDARDMKRAGRNPLVISAVDRYNQPFSGDPLISDQDADFLTKAAQRDGFFKKYNVIFLID